MPLMFCVSGFLVVLCIVKYCTTLTFSPAEMNRMRAVDTDYNQAECSLPNCCCFSSSAAVSLPSAAVSPPSAAEKFYCGKEGRQYNLFYDQLLLYRTLSAPFVLQLQLQQVLPRGLPWTSTGAQVQHYGASTISGQMVHLPHKLTLM